MNKRVSAKKMKEIIIDYLKPKSGATFALKPLLKIENNAFLVERDLVCCIELIESDDKLYRFYINKETEIQYKLSENKRNYKVNLEIDDFHISISRMEHEQLSVLLKSIKDLNATNENNVEIIEQKNIGKNRFLIFNERVAKNSKLSWVIFALFVIGMFMIEFYGHDIFESIK